MSMLHFKGLSRQFGGEDLFSALSAKVPGGSAIGIVGPNGIGKSTLMHLLAGLEQPDQGEIHRSKGLSVAYLTQEAAQAFAHGEHSVQEELHSVFSTLKEMEQELSELEHQMSQNESPEVLERYGDLQERYQQQGGYEYALRVEQTLQGLGFGKESWTMPLDHCSGGQKTRVLLAKILLQKPDLLLLDEPTNHLDRQAVEWLENFLSQWEGAFVVVSHDRYFLDRVCSTIWEMSSLGLEVYKGNYSRYLSEREIRWKHRVELFDSTLEFFLREMDYVKKYIASKRPEQAQGRLKRLVRHVKAVEIAGPQALQVPWNAFCLEYGGISSSKWSVHDTEMHIKALSLRRPIYRNIAMQFKNTGHLSDKVLAIDGAVFGYPGNPLVKTGEVELRGGMRVALLGANGTGKTTLLKTLIGQLPLLEGRSEMGAFLKPAYFSQEQEILDDRNTVIQQIVDLGLKETEARQYLGRYLFSGDDVFKSVSVLSGGERGRLILAILALREVNFLILDEPTNHLDLQAREVLETALDHFEGALLLVSHDRYLVDRTATHIWYIQEGELSVFQGNYSEWYQAQRSAKESITKESRENQTQRVSRKRVKPVEIDDSLTPEELELKILELEAQMTALASDMDEASMEDARHMNRQFLELQQELQKLLDQWEDASA